MRCPISLHLPDQCPREGELVAPPAFRELCLFLRVVGQVLGALLASSTGVCSAARWWAVECGAATTVD
jgi:hypothetical protein